MLKNQTLFLFLAFCLSLFLGYAPNLLAADQDITQPIIAPTSSPNLSVNSPANASANLPVILAPTLDFFLDPSSKLVFPEILLPEYQAKFAQLRELPPKTGRMWLRLNVPAGLLDLNSRILGLVPGQARVWALSPQKAPQAITAIANNIFPIELASQVYLSLDGVPGLGFTPLLRPSDSLNFFDRQGKNLILGLLALALLLCLMRGLTEKREWRMWAALYISSLLVNIFWGLPISLQNTVNPWEMPALFAPGIALLLVPQLGRHLMRTRLEAPKLDMGLLLVSLMGLTVPALALLPDQTWIIRFLPYWPLALILTLPLALWACAQRLTKSYLFLSLTILPSLGIVLISPSLSVFYPWLISFTSLPPSAAISMLSLTPLFFVSLSALGLALSPSPSLGTGAVRINRKGKETRPGSRDANARDRLDHIETLDPSSDSRSNSIFDPMDSKSNNINSPLELDPDQSHKLAINLPPEPKSIPQFSKQLRQPLEIFWDTFWRELSFLETKLPLEAKKHYLNLSQAGHSLSQKLAKFEANPQKNLNQKPEANPLQYFDLNQMLLAVHDKIAPDAEAKNLALSWFVAPHLPRVYEGNYAALHEVLNLLAQSSVMATDRGLIQIKAGRLPESTDPGHLLFSIVDTGKGTPPNKRSSLALVRAWELVGPQGGSLTVDSGQSGTNISFSLHLKPKLAPTQASSSQKLDASLVQKMVLRIIIASTSSSNRQLLAYYLDELPHEILEANSAQEVYTLYTRSPGSLLIFDDDLPLDDLSHALAQIRAFEGEHSFPLASILALVSSEAKAETLRRAGCTHILQKPVLRQKLRLLALRLAPVPKRHALDLNNLPTATSGKPVPMEKSPPEPKLDQPATSSASKPSHEKAYKKGILSSIFSFSPKTPSELPKKNLPEPAPKKHRILSNVGEPTPMAGDPNHVPFKILPSHKATEAKPPIISQNSQAPSQATEWVGEPKPILKNPNRDLGKTVKINITKDSKVVEKTEPGKSAADMKIIADATAIEIVENSGKLDITPAGITDTIEINKVVDMVASRSAATMNTITPAETVEVAKVKTKQSAPPLNMPQPAAWIGEPLPLADSKTWEPLLKTAAPHKYELILKPEPDKNDPPIEVSLTSTEPSPPAEVSLTSTEPSPPAEAKIPLTLESAVTSHTLPAAQNPSKIIPEAPKNTPKTKGTNKSFLSFWFNKPKPEPTFQLHGPIEWVGEPKPILKPSASSSPVATDWVAEPKPILKTEATPASNSPNRSIMHAPEAKHSAETDFYHLDWVGEPKPIQKAEALSTDWVGEPKPIQKPKLAPIAQVLNPALPDLPSTQKTLEHESDNLPPAKVSTNHLSLFDSLEMPKPKLNLDLPEIKPLKQIHLAETAPLDLAPASLADEDEIITLTDQVLELQPAKTNHPAPEQAHGTSQNQQAPTGLPANQQAPTSLPENQQAPTGQPENQQAPTSLPENQQAPTGQPANQQAPTGQPENQQAQTLQQDIHRSNLPDLFGSQFGSKPSLPDLFADLDNPMPDLEAALILAQQGQATKDYDTVLTATTKLTILAENFALHTVADISTCLAEAAYAQNKSEVDSFIADLKHTLEKMKS